MTTISGDIALNAPGVRLIDTSKLKAVHVAEAPKEVYDRIVEAQQRMLESRHTQRPDTSQNPTYKPYATVTVNGKVVAEIDNHGWTKTSNALGGKLSRGLPNEANGVITGPELAQARAEFIADMLGGEVEISATALTQRQFNAIPQPRSTVDYDAMRQDPAYESLQKLKQARTAFLTQQLAQEPQSEAAAEENDPVQEFLSYMDQSWEEQYFEAFLKSKNLTEEEFEALDPEDRQALLDEFREELRREIEQGDAGKADKRRA